MKTITAPTTRRLVVGGYKPGHFDITLADPRLALCVIPAGWHYATRPVNLLRIVAQNGAEWQTLKLLDDEDLYKRQTRFRFDTWPRYSATLYVIRTILGELAWDLTADEQALIDALEAYGAAFITRQANAA